MNASCDLLCQPVQCDTYLVLARKRTILNLEGLLASCHLTTIVTRSLRCTLCGQQEERDRGDKAGEDCEGGGEGCEGRGKRVIK